METYVTTIFVHEQALKHLVSIYNNPLNYPDAYKQTYDHFIDETRNQENYPLIFLSVPKYDATQYSDDLEYVTE